MKRIAGAVLVSLVLGTPAAALEREPVHLWIGGSFGLGTYAMSDANLYLNKVNHVTGLSLPPISKGYAFGLEVGGQITPALSISGGYERLTASSKQTTGTVEASEGFGAGIFRGTARCLLHRTANGGIGVAASAGTLSTSGNSHVFGGRISGKGDFFEGAGTVEYETVTPLVFTMSLGYRVARTTDFRIKGVPAYIDGAGARIDYSGVAVRVGARLNLF